MKPRKICSDCKQLLPISCFYKNSAMADGRSIYCKLCQEKRTERSRENRVKTAQDYRASHEIDIMNADPLDLVKAGERRSCEIRLAIHRQKMQVTA